MNNNNCLFLSKQHYQNLFKKVIWFYLLNCNALIVNDVVQYTRFKKKSLIETKIRCSLKILILIKKFDFYFFLASTLKQLGFTLILVWTWLIFNRNMNMFVYK